MNLYFGPQPNRTGRHAQNDEREKTRGMQACGAFSFMNGKSTARDEMFRQNSSPSAANSISFN